MSLFLPSRHSPLRGAILLDARQHRLSSTSASSVASTFLSKFQSLGPQSRTQFLDANQLQLLSLTLSRPSLFRDSPRLSNTANPPPHGTPLPPGYHLVYFTPAFLEEDLGADGTDTSYNPSPPFTRRMWAGGEVQWPRNKSGRANPLRTGQEVVETTKVLYAEPKVVKKTGEDMIVVGVEKELRNEDGIAVIDRRNWVFRRALTESAPAQAPSGSASISTAPASSSTVSTGSTHTRTLRQSLVTLFRFSALTFNAHKIHLLPAWACGVEGHIDIVVHGPLNLISILDLWRDVRTENSENSDPGRLLPESISYRATSPLYVGDEYQIILEEDESDSKVQIFNPKGVVAMKAEIKGFNIN